MNQVIDINTKRIERQSKELGVAPPPTLEEQQDLTGRIARIRSSIERINKLMAELKAMSPANKNKQHSSKITLNETKGGE